jgi:purine-binding chemotaxis protein CheW
MLEQKLITFKFGGITCGIPLLDVREIIPQMEYTSVPLAMPYVQGLINLRGQIVTLVDLTKIFKQSSLKLQYGKYNIILRNEAYAQEGLSPTDRTGFGVDSIGEVLPYFESELDAPPANLNELDARWIEAVLKRPEGIVTVLNMSNIIKEALHASLTIV